MDLFSTKNQQIKSITTSLELLRKLWTWTMASDIEISALGDATILGDSLNVTNRTYLLKQEGSFGHTEIDGIAVADCINSQIMAGNDPSNIRFHFHTHPKMSVFFSETDMGNVETLHQSMPIVIAGIFNEKGDTRWGLMQHGIWLEWELNISKVVPHPDFEEIQSAKALLSRYVSKKAHSFKYKHLCTKRQGKDWCAYASGHVGTCSFDSVETDWMHW